MKKGVALLLGILLALTCLPAVAARAAEEGESVGDFTVPLLDGTTFRLSEQRGKVVFVNVWATWCPPCVAEMPDIQKLADAYPDKLVVLGLNSGEDEGTVRAFIEENGYTYPIGLDPRGKVGNAHFPTDGIPYTVFIDANGVVRQTHLGGGRNMYDTFEGYLKDALTYGGLDPDASTGGSVSAAERKQIEYVINLLSANRRDFDLINGAYDTEAMHLSILSALLLSGRFESRNARQEGYHGDFSDFFTRADYNEVVTGVFGQSADSFPELLPSGVFGFEAAGATFYDMRIDKITSDSQGYFHVYGTILQASTEDGPTPVEKSNYHAILRKSNQALFGFYILVQELSGGPISGGGGGSGGALSSKKITASSAYKDYTAEKAADGNDSTYWLYDRNAYDDYSRAVLHIRLTRPSTVTELHLHNGGWKNDDRYWGYSRPKEISVCCYDGNNVFLYEKTFLLNDSGLGVESVLSLGSIADVDSISVQVLSRYHGNDSTKKRFIAISEISVYGD